jgi:hypothetical protein
MFSVRRTAKNPRVLMLLVAFSFFLLLLAMSNTKPVYAAGTVPAPQRIIPGGDDGGPTPAPNTIYGQLESLGALGPYPAHVLVNLIQFTSIWTIYTDDIGCFQFQTGAYYPGQTSLVIMPNIRYEITVNGGWLSDMGGWIPDPAWGQWAGYVVTDSTGWAQVYPRLQPAAVVNVPAAALFSNTKYATVSYEMQSTYTVSHSLTFSVPTAGITVGYQQSTTATYGMIFTVKPNCGATVSGRHYAASFWDDTDSPPGVKKTGISGSDPCWYWDFLSQSEYLNTSNPVVVSNHKEMSVDPVGTVEGWYSEQGSTKWSVSQGVPFAVGYRAYGTNLNLDIVVTTSSSNKVNFKIDRSNDTNPNTLTFWLYTAGALCDPDAHQGGMEFHIWDMSGAG